jgi:hypothetical protein
MTHRHGHMDDLFDTAPRKLPEDEKSYGFAADGTELKWFHIPIPKYVNPNEQTPETIRVKIDAALAKARAATVQPFTPQELNDNCSLWPVWTEWFDKKVAKELTQAFETEMRRLIPEDHPDFWNIARISKKLW